MGRKRNAHQFRRSDWRAWRSFALYRSYRRKSARVAHKLPSAGPASSINATSVTEICVSVRVYQKITPYAKYMWGDFRAQRTTAGGFSVQNRTAAAFWHQNRRFLRRTSRPCRVCENPRTCRAPSVSRRILAFPSGEAKICSAQKNGRPSVARPYFRTILRFFNMPRCPLSLREWSPHRGRRAQPRQN